MRMNRQQVLIPLMMAAVAQLSHPGNALAAPKICAEVFSPELRNAKYSDLKTAWKQSQIAIAELHRQAFGMDNAIRSLLTAVVAREFVWMNGDPGGAKTYVSRLVFESVLKTLPERDKRIFILQFHKLIAEGKITGFVKFEALMQKGRYEIETSTSLVGDQYLFLIADEAEKANAATLNALLSVLNERKAFLGSRVVDSLLASGVFTSNKTLGEFIKSFLDDRPSGEALLDRQPIKIHVTDQFATAKLKGEFYLAVKRAKADKLARPDLPLLEIGKLADQVQVPPEIMNDIAEIAREFDGFVTEKADGSRKEVRYGQRENEYFPANQFSTRSVRRLAQVFKAAFIVDQLMSGVAADQIRMSVERRDLHLLATCAVYGSPARITHKSIPLGKMHNQTFQPSLVKVVDTYGLDVSLRGDWNPWARELTLSEVTNNTRQMVVRVGKDGHATTLFAEGDLTLPPEELANAMKHAAEAEVDNGIDLKKPTFVVEGPLEQLINKDTVTHETKQELTSILEDSEMLAQRLNTQIEKPATAPHVQMPTENGVSKAEFRKARAEIRKGNMSAIKFSYEMNQRGYKAMVQRFPELEHSIEAHFTALTSGEHLYVFGPPGGAKTALADAILKAELKTVNNQELNRYIEKVLARLAEQNEGKGKQDADRVATKKFLAQVLKRMHDETHPDRPNQFKTFILQFHKLLPEGVLAGFPKTELQLKEGKEVIDTSTSLAGRDFLFAILDEVDKANPQTLVSLLSILNEREVMVGGQVIKASLRTAILTSNKMTSELLDSYYEDRSSGTALLRRAINKVFVNNKLSTTEELAKFLIKLENGVKPEFKGLLAVHELRSLADQVEIEDHIVQMLAQIEERFIGKRMAEAKKSRDFTKEDPREAPDYYVPASTAATATFEQLVDQLKSRLIVRQLAEGVPFEKLRYKVELNDLHLFFEGLAFWAPQHLTSGFDTNGIVEFKADSTTLNRIAQGNFSNARVRYHAEQMAAEARDFVEVLNSEVQNYVTEYRAMVAKSPNLFPLSGVFLNEAARQRAIQQVQ